MSTSVFINLPVANVATATTFFTGLGFSLNPAFSDGNTNCVTVTESVSAMLQSTETFKSFAQKPIADSAKTTGAIFAVGVETRDRVDEIADKALSTGGQFASEAQDHGFMYGRSFFDPDGHHWEIMWMDPNAEM